MTTPKHNTSTPGPLKDLSGKPFGRLVAQRYVGGSRWECLCVCGSITLVTTRYLINGTSTSCGCRKRDSTLPNTYQPTHGLSHHPIYQRWRHMLSRCYCPSHEAYHYYGGRGIRVCERWRHSVANFYADMGDPPPGMTLDRIDTNKHYEPGNCRWATPKQQARNRRSNRLLTFNGETFPLSVWAEKLNIKWATLEARLRKGQSVEDALTTPVLYRRQA